MKTLQSLVSSIVWIAGSLLTCRGSDNQQLGMPYSRHRMLIAHNMAARIRIGVHLCESDNNGTGPGSVQSMLDLPLVQTAEPAGRMNLERTG